MSGPASPDKVYPDWATLQARHIAAHRAQAVKAARAAAAAAAPFGVRVIVFGSLATGRFHRGSDLDLALEGPEGALFEAGNAAFGAALRHGFEPDVVELEHASPRLAAKIREQGRDAGDLE
ncbi:MAG TPA: nucleotidyltransferase domain-containing protein [Falsiroseomonas sp.]|jgi:predicted nucleotidyltransferase|nr:nucleotidyltransferase domain-containing protein [Falsiroseomonas sp.]